MMAKTNPKVSVIIPAYNQANFLSAAIHSVLAQTCRDFEIIVVDDGSQDDTAAVAKEFGDQIHYLYQSNLGLAGARNTGIRAARGEYIGLLDSDDMWMPEYLQEMLSLAKQHAEAVVFYCGAICMDQDGKNLKQTMGWKEIGPNSLYHTLIRANFIIPSTVLMRRDIVTAAGLFDQQFRSCEDKDLWLRLLPQYTFAGIPTPLVRYRIHGSSLSTNISRMQQSTRSVIEKNFGADDGMYARWSTEKRQAYGGVYRYFLLSSIQRQNNWQCGEYLRKAIQIDPSLAKDEGMFYDMAFGNQPVGFRDLNYNIDVEENENKICSLLKSTYLSDASPESRRIFHTTYGSALRSLSLIAYGNNRFSLSREYTLRALRHRPDLWKDKTFIGNLLKSFLGKTGLSYIRGLRNKHRTNPKK